MKHTTLPALAIAGAMTLAVVPAADAQSANGSSAAVSGTQTPSASPAPATTSASATASVFGSSGQEDMKPLNKWEAGKEAGTWEGASWYYHSDKQHVVLKQTDYNKGLDKVNPDDVLTINDFADQAGYQRPGATEPTTSPASASSELSSMEMLPFATPGQEIPGPNGQTWYYNKDLSYVVNSKELIDSTVKNGEAGVKLTIDFAREMQRSLPINLMLESGSSALTAPATPGAPAPQGSSMQGTTQTTQRTETTGQGTMGSSAEDLTRLVVIGLPAVLLVGGLTWYLNQDGQTYMSSSSRTSETPTEQERASSASMLSSNRSEVQRQGSSLGSSALGSSALGSSALGSSGQGSSGSSDQKKSEGASRDEVRGIAAETGSNGLARGLFALLLASVLGAAAFHFGRKQLV